MKTSPPFSERPCICVPSHRRAGGVGVAWDAGRFARFARVLAMVAGCLPLVSVHAASDNWTSTTSGLWGTAGNWSGGVPIATTAARFNLTSPLQTSITLSSASVAKNLTFLGNGGANAFTFDTALTQNANTLTLSTGISNADAATQTFYNKFILAGSQSWSSASGTMVFNGDVDLGSGATSFTLTVSGAMDTSISGDIADGSTSAGALAKSAAGNLTLTGNNTYTGGTTISAGTLTAGSSNALGSATGGTTISGATLALTNGISLAEGISVTGAGVSSNVGAISNTSGTNTITGNIAQTGATTYNAAAGTQLTLAGNTTGNFAVTYGKGTGNCTVVLTGTNSYTAATSVAAGTVLVGTNTGLGTGTTTVASGATLGFQGGVTDNQAIGISGAGMAGSAGALESFSGTNITSGTVTLNAASTIGAITGQTLDLNGTLAIKTFALTLGTSPGSGNVNIAGQITGTTGTITDAFGTAVFSNSTNSYAGGTTINSGATLIAAANNALGTGVGGTTVNSVGTLGFQGGINYSTVEAVTLNGTGVGGNGAIKNVSGTNTFAGGLTLGSTSTISAAASSQLNLSGAIGLAGHNLTLGSATSSGTVNTTGVISGSGNITAAGGTAVLGNAGNTFTGTNQVITGATLQVGSSGALGNAANGVTLSGGTLQETSSFTVASTHGITLANGGGGGTIDTQANNVTYNGVIAGTGTDALTKAGSGTLSLGGANTYVGATNINGGTLSTSVSNVFNNNSLLTIGSSGTFSLLGSSQKVGALAGTGALAFGSGGSLTLSSGSGTFGGSISGSGTLTIGAGATLTLGANFNDASLNLDLAGGSLFLNGTTSTLGSLTLTGNSIIDFGSPSATTLNISNLNLNGFTLTVQDWTKALDFMYTQTFTGATHDTFGTAPENKITFNGYTNNDTSWQSFDNQVTAAPEPAWYGAVFVSLSLGIVVYTGRRRARLAAC